MPIVVSHDVHKNFTDGVFAIKQEARKSEGARTSGFVTRSQACRGHGWAAVAPAKPYRAFGGLRVGHQQAWRPTPWVHIRQHRAGGEDRQSSEPLAFIALTTAKTTIDGNPVRHKRCSSRRFGLRRLSAIPRGRRPCSQEAPCASWGIVGSIPGLAPGASKDL